MFLSLNNKIVTPTYNHTFNEHRTLLVDIIKRKGELTDKFSKTY